MSLILSCAMVMTLVSGSFVHAYADDNAEKKTEIVEADSLDSFFEGERDGVLEEAAPEIENEESPASEEGIEDEIESLAREYTDRFIIKSNNSEISDKAVIKAYSAAKVDKGRSVTELKQKNEEEFAKLDLDETSGESEIVLSENALSILNSAFYQSISEESVTMSNAADDKVIVELPELVSPDTFIKELSLELNGGIEYVQPDYKLEAFDSEDEDENNQQDSSSLASEAPVSEPTEEPESEPTLLPDADPFNVLQDDIQSAWQITKGGGVKVAVIDGKVDVTHPDISSHVVNGFDIAENRELIYNGENKEEYSHGTHITGIIASTVPEAEIIPIAAFKDEQAYTSDIITAIEYAKEQGADIVNCSWGSTDNNQALKEAMENSGMLFICAAGNNRMNIDETPVYPAGFDIDNIISVTSLNQDMGFSYYSNYGTSVDIAMYGRNVYNALPGGEYGERSGTSMAAAYVTAAAAMAEAIDPESNIKDTVLNTSVSLSNLEGKVNGGRRLSYSNLAYNIESNDVIEIMPEDDFDVNTYVRTPSENWELFNSVETIAVEAGGSNTAFIKSDGTLWMAGNNSYGQLGDGTYQNSSTPVQVIGVSNVEQVAVGLNHCIALDRLGHAYVWGYNADNAVSSSADAKINTPVIHPLSNIEYVEAGTQTTFVIQKRTGVYGNGRNNYGQLGIGSKNTTATPVLIAGSDYASMVKSFGKHKFYIKNGVVYGCGSNDHDILGPNVGTQTRPIEIINAVEIDTGTNHAVSVDSSGVVHTWGANDYGQCGTGADGTVPLNVQNAESVKCGADFTIIMLRDGTVLTWGYNSDGQIGSGDTTRQYVPYTVAISVPVCAIAAGSSHSIALDDNYDVWRWGYNASGQYGTGSTSTYYRPTKANAGTIVKQNAAIGKNHELYIDKNGKLYSRGSNTYGQLGTGDNSSREKPVQITGPWGDKKIVKAETRYNTSFVITEDNVLYGWGQDDSRQLGDVAHQNSNVPVQILTDVNDARAGAAHTAALRTNGDVYIWGNNTYGQLGESVQYEDIPVKVYSGAKSIAAGDYQTFILTASNVLYATGRNDKGQLGLGSTTNCSSFTSVRNAVLSVSGGALHTVIRDTSGMVYTFGDNSFKQLGVTLANGAVYSSSPVSTGVSASYVFAGGNSTAYIQNGKVYQTGKMGQLSTAGFKVINNTANFTADALGDEYALGTDNSSTIYRWGSMTEKINLSFESDIHSVHYPYLLNNIDAGRDQLLAINGLGQVVAWGEGFYADGYDGMEVKKYPTVINGIDYAAQVCRGKDHNLVLDVAGNVWCWGGNTDYPMSNNLEGRVKNAVKMPGISDVKQVAAGEGFSMFLKKDGTLWGVGKNNAGQLGQKYTSSSIGTPVQIMKNGEAVIKVSAGDDYAAAVTNSGIYVWGNNDKYQLGDGTKTVNSTPAKLNITLDDGEYFTDISAGIDACAALTNLGNVYTWGDYGEGVSGDTGKIPTL